MTDAIDDFRRSDDALIAKARRNADNVALLTTALGHERLAYNILRGSTRSCTTSS